MKRIVWVLACGVLVYGSACGQAGEFDQLLKAMLAYDQRTITEPMVAIANCNDPRFDKVTFMATDTLPQMASSVMATKDTAVVAVLTSSRGKRYTLFKTELGGGGLPSLVRSKANSAIVDYAEFPLDDERSLVVEDKDHDGRIDNIQVPLDGSDYGVLQVDTSQRAFRFLVFDNKAAVYRVSAELRTEAGVPKVKSISYYSGEDWVEFILNIDGATYKAANQVHRMRGGKRVSTDLTATTDPLLRSANERREQVAAWVTQRLGSAWAEWCANRGRVKRSGVVGYQFPLILDLVK